MKDLIKRIVAFAIQAIVGFVMFAALVAFLVDYLSGCGQTYIDSTGASHPVATSDQCIIVKHHNPQ